MTTNKSLKLFSCTPYVLVMSTDILMCVSAEATEGDLSVMEDFSQSLTLKGGNQGGTWGLSVGGCVTAGFTGFRSIP